MELSKIAPDFIMKIQIFDFSNLAHSKVLCLPSADTSAEPLYLYGFRSLGQSKLRMISSRSWAKGKGRTMAAFEETGTDMKGLTRDAILAALREAGKGSRDGWMVSEPSDRKPPAFH